MCYNYCVKADERHIKKAERSLMDAAKTARKALKITRKEAYEPNEEVERQLYGAGIAD